MKKRAFPFAFAPALVVGVVVVAAGIAVAAPDHAPPQGADLRAPLPLLPMMAAHQKANMRDHLQAVQEITAALAAADYDAVIKAEKRLGYSDEMAQQCTHMGMAAPGFTERALDFHKSADAIAVAASHKNATETLAALSSTLAKCTSCHASYRQEIVDEATWKKLTATPPPARAFAK